MDGEAIMATIVSTVTKVKDGRHTFQFDLSDNKLVIEYRHGKKVPVYITLSEFSLSELRRLLTVVRPPVALAVVERPADSLPKDGLQGRETEEGLIQTGDGIESGMD